MWYALVGLVPALTLSSVESPDAMFYTQRFLFAPPTCEYRVVFPAAPQKVGVLANNEAVYSAQLRLNDSYMRADCQAVNPPETEQSQQELLYFTAQYTIHRMGGDALLMLDFDVNQHQATFTAQLFMQNEPILIRGLFILGGQSLLSLTSIERDRFRAGKAAERFITSALTLANRE